MFLTPLSEVDITQLGKRCGYLGDGYPGMEGVDRCALSFPPRFIASQDVTLACRRP